MRSAAAAFWLAAVQMAVALLVGNILAKRIAVMLYHLLAALSW